MANRLKGKASWFHQCRFKIQHMCSKRPITALRNYDFFISLLNFLLFKAQIVVIRVRTCVQDRRPGPDVHGGRRFLRPQQFTDELRGHHTHRAAHLHDPERTA